MRSQNLYKSVQRIECIRQGRRNLFRTFAYYGIGTYEIVAVLIKKMKKLPLVFNHEKTIGHL